MAVRKNFKPAEREIFVQGAIVQWCHGSRWVPAMIIDGVIRVDSIGSKYMLVEYTGPTTRTISHGAVIQGHPGGIRPMTITF